MIEYLPWSKAVHLKNMNRYLRGKFSCLDIELGGECNFHCVYCDSPDRNKVCRLSVKSLGQILSTGEFEWIYICGLGEPTYHHNLKILLELLEYCRIYNVRCSIFSNLSQLNDSLIKYIECGVLHIFFKYDSYDLGITSALYGTRKVSEQLNNIKKLKKYVRVENGTTNFSASIVPTRLNKEYILPIVEECLNANIFPLLGELENSGKGEMNYANLCLAESELLELKSKIEEKIGEKYEIPVCPSVISGIHFSYDGYITVDKYSGLSCHWFWLKEPEVVKLMQCTEEIDIGKAVKEILAYREGCMGNVKDFLSKAQKIGGAFGGCGGDVRYLFEQYFQAHQNKEILL